MDRVREPTKLDDEEVLAALNAELNSARSLRDGRIGRERRLAYEYYFGEPFGNEEAGQSKIVSQLVMEVIDSLMPDVMKVFCGSDKAVEFVARKAEDVELAEQATEVCNYVFFTQNQGFLLLYESIKDAFLQKTGCWKYWWDEDKKVTEESYQGLNEGQLLQVAQDPEVEIVQASTREAPGLPQMTPQGPVQGPPQKLYDVVLKRTKNSGHICIESVPPDEILTSERARTIDPQKLDFIAHETHKTLSQLVEMGYPLEVIMELPTADSETPLSEAETARQTRNDLTFTGMDNSTAADPMARVVRYTEAYMLLDADGDGISELRKICKVDHTILHNEVTERVPLAIITPKIMPHEFHGISLADDCMDLQLLKSTLWRQELNKLYLANFPRFGIVENMATANTYADLLSPQVGKPIRMKAAGAVTPLSMPYSGDSLQMLEMIEQEIEGRTPVSRQYQGLQGDEINKTATSAHITSNRATARVELICRTFAETGIKDLFRGVLWLLGKYQQEQMIVRLNDKYVPIDPRAWKTEYDMSVNVGLGTGSKAEQMALLASIEGAQEKIAMSPLMGVLVTPKNLYNLQSKKAIVAGFKDPNVFWTAPPDNWQPPPPPPPPEIAIEQMKQQGAQQKLQQEGQMKSGELQLQDQMKQRELQSAQTIQASNDARDWARTQAELSLKDQMHQREMAQKDVADQRAQETAKEIENIKAAAMIEAARVKANQASGEAVMEMDMEKAGQAVTEQGNSQMTQLTQSVQQLHEHMQNLHKAVTAPKRLVRGPDGRAVGVETVQGK